MFYKVIFNKKVVDVLETINYVKYLEDYNRMVLCDEKEAQGIISSDGMHIWHEETLPKIPTKGYDTVRIEEIDEFEYRQLRVFNGKTAEEIIDEYTLMLLEGGLL